MRTTIPNWSQSLIAKAAGLDPGGLIVRLDNDRLLCVMEVMTRIHYIIDKSNGTVKKS